jgi:hypothetical protein
MRDLTFTRTTIVQRAVAAADALPAHADRARALAELSTTAPPGERAAILARALQAARLQIMAGETCDRIDGAAALAFVARRLSPAQRRGVLGEALATIGSTDENRWSLTEALRKLAADLPPSLMREALAIARTIDAGSAGHHALVL